jgi:hypothetical protein
VPTKEHEKNGIKHRQHRVSPWRNKRNQTQAATFHRERDFRKRNINPQQETNNKTSIEKKTTQINTIAQLETAGQ